MDPCKEGSVERKTLGICVLYFAIYMSFSANSNEFIDSRIVSCFTSLQSRVLKACLSLSKTSRSIENKFLTAFSELGIPL